MGFKLSLDKSEIKKALGGGLEPLPEGTYGAVIFEAVETTSKNGNDMYRINFRITEGPEGVGRKIFGYFTVTGKALFSVVGLLKATGFPYPDKDTPAGEFEFPDAEDFVGKEVNIKITQTPYTSEDDDGNIVTAYRNNVSRVYSYDADKISIAEDEEATSGGQFL